MKKLRTLESIYLQIIKEGTELEVDLDDPHHYLWVGMDDDRLDWGVGGPEDLNEDYFDIFPGFEDLYNESVPFLFLREEDVIFYGSRELIEEINSYFNTHPEMRSLEKEKIIDIAKMFDYTYVYDFDRGLHTLEHFKY